MKSTSILLILAMVGTGFGQDAPAIPYCTGTEAHKAKVTGKNILCMEPPVDVPAIQEDVDEGVWFSLGPAIPQSSPECAGELKFSGRVDSGKTYKYRCIVRKWTCEDKENRALLTSVNGKRHSCHRIEP